MPNKPSHVFPVRHAHEGYVTQVCTATQSSQVKAEKGAPIPAL